MLGMSFVMKEQCLATSAVGGSLPLCPIRKMLFRQSVILLSHEANSYGGNMHSYGAPI